MIADPPAPAPSSVPTTNTQTQIPPSTTHAEAKNVDLNPTSPATTTAPTAATTTAPVVEKAVEKKTDPNGMSATSGPLDDGIAHGFGEASTGKGEAEGVGKTKVEKEIMDPEVEKAVESEGMKGESAAA